LEHLFGNKVIYIMKNTRTILSIPGLAFIIILLLSSFSPVKQVTHEFIHVDKQNLIAPGGKPFLIKGINLGNWLNPEGYMFLFKKTNSYRLIDEAFKEMVGPEFVNSFWQKFQNNYITRQDIHFIHQTGMNTVRIPFHYKLFTKEDYMGSNNSNRGFELLDRVINWCHEEGIYVILDMHDAPGGQTGDNIDDSYGYPWLMVNENDQKLFCNIWQKIACHYADNPTVLGYDLLNEPIATYFGKDMPMLNKKLEPLYQRAVSAIRKVDKNHVVILGGAQWDGNFKVFHDYYFDNNLMFTCHRYWCDTTQKAIQDFLNFRTKTGLPLYMGETGENTDAWIHGFRALLEKNNIGWTFWPYKKMEKSSCMISIQEPKYWNKIVEFTTKDNSTFKNIRKNRPSQDTVRMALNGLLKNLKISNCKINKKYIAALGMKP
jgi:endoglucanase